MFAGDNPAVDGTDIVLSVDANLFVMSPEIIQPLISSPDMVAWVLNWNWAFLFASLDSRKHKDFLLEYTYTHTCSLCLFVSDKSGSDPSSTSW